MSEITVVHRPKDKSTASEDEWHRQLKTIALIGTRTCSVAYTPGISDEGEGQNGSSRVSLPIRSIPSAVSTVSANVGVGMPSGVSTEEKGAQSASVNRSSKKRSAPGDEADGASTMASDDAARKKLVTTVRSYSIPVHYSAVPVRYTQTDSTVGGSTQQGPSPQSSSVERRPWRIDRALQLERRAQQKRTSRQTDRPDDTTQLSRTLSTLADRLHFCRFNFAPREYKGKGECQLQPPLSHRYEQMGSLLGMCEQIKSLVPSRFHTESMYVPSSLHEQKELLHSAAQQVYHTLVEAHRGLPVTTEPAARESWWTGYQTKKLAETAAGRDGMSEAAIMRVLPHVGALHRHLQVSRDSHTTKGLRQRSLYPTSGLW